jgi:rare lipoprotein A
MKHSNLQWMWSFLCLAFLFFSSSIAYGNIRPSKNPGAYFQNDGPPAHIKINLDQVPDAIPRHEPLIASANRPYSALGMRFSPDTKQKGYRKTGRASWYGKQFHGRKTSSGERYNMFAMTAAHPTLPIPSYVRVINKRNGKMVTVRVNDRGPFHKGRIIDVSYAAAHRLGFIKSGSTEVTVEQILPTKYTRSWEEDNQLLSTNTTTYLSEDEYSYLNVLSPQNGWSAAIFSNSVLIASSSYNAHLVFKSDQSNDKIARALELIDPIIIS